MEVLNDEEKSWLPSNNNVKNPVTVHFQNISYSCKQHVFSKEKKQILKKVSGVFQPGKLTAIIGPSGSGKTTLMNILLGYVTNGVTGEIFINNQNRCESNFQWNCCYITQENKLQPLLQVQEAMMFAANLKLPVNIRKEEKEASIKEIMEDFKLHECRNTLIGQLSGGERKRLGVALEFIRSPSVMFCDEPTSGLDEVAAKQMISLLKKLARQGRTIVCTIHQPSASTLEIFDQLYCLINGQCVYQGTVIELLAYLEEFNPPLKCPKFHNPVDFLIDVGLGVFGDHLSDMISRRNEQFFAQVENERNEKCEKDTNNYEVNQSPSKVYATPFCNQLVELSKRNFVILKRDKDVVIKRIVVNMVSSLIIGILYFGIGQDGRHTLNNFSLIFINMMNVAFVSFTTMMISFSEEMSIVTREHFNLWYSILSYYISVTVTDLPIQFFSVLLCLAISYFLTGQPTEGFRFGLYTVMMLLMSLVAQAFGMWFGALFRVELSVLLGPVLLNPFIVFSGYLVFIKDAPDVWQWAFHLSFLKYGLEGAAHSIMGFNRTSLPCPPEADHCHFDNPQILLEQIGIEERRIIIDLSVLVGYYVILKILIYLTMLIRIRGKR